MCHLFISLEKQSDKKTSFIKKIIFDAVSIAYIFNLISRQLFPYCWSWWFGNLFFIREERPIKRNSTKFFFIF
jgi:hypothetical protein